MKQEDKNTRFKRLAVARGEKVLKDLQLIANLSNRNNYDYSESDVRKLFDVIDEELKHTKYRFKSKKKVIKL